MYVFEVLFCELHEEIRQSMHHKGGYDSIALSIPKISITRYQSGQLPQSF
jgi:hypothetical protein